MSSNNRAVAPRRAGRAAGWAAALALVAGAITQADPVAPTPDLPAPHGVLDLGDEGFVAGRLVPAAPEADGRSTLLWESPLFAAPLEFRLDALRGIRFALPAAGEAGSRRVHLRGGDVLSGNVVALDGRTLTLALEHAAGTHVTIDRAEIESIARHGAGGASFDGPGGLLDWRQSSPGTWQEEAGRLLGAIAGTSVTRDVGAPPRCRFDVVLSWRGRPEFRVVLGVEDDDAPDRYWLEAVDAPGGPTLMLVRREADGARLQPLDLDLAGLDRIRLVIFVDRDAGRMAVVAPEVADTPLADVTLPPATRRKDAGGFRLALNAGDICLERLQVVPWQADGPSLVESQGAVVATARERMGDVTVDAFVGQTDSDGATPTARGTWHVRRGGEMLLLSDDDVLEVRFSPPAVPPGEEPPLRVVLAAGDRVSGRLHAVGDDALLVTRGGIAEPVPLPFGGLVVVQSARPAVPADLPGRVGTLGGVGLSLRGCFVGAEGGDARVAGAARGVEWLSAGALRAVPFLDTAEAPLAATVDYVALDAQLADGEEWVGGIGGVVNQDGDGLMAVTMLTEDGAAARDGRLLPGDRIVAVRCSPQAPFVDTAGLETETVMNLLRGRVGTPVALRVAVAAGEPREIELVRGPIGVFGRDVLETALKAHARHAVVPAPTEGDGYPALAFLSDGDVVRCRVERIDATGARLATPVGDEHVPPCDVSADRLQAIELVPSAPSRVLDAMRVERLLTVPRMQRDRPPTHLLRLLDGDYVRGRLDVLDDTTARIEVLGNEQEVPRAAVARVIWLRESDAAVAHDDEDGSGGLPMRAEWGDGRRLRFTATGFADGWLRGRSVALGDVHLEIEDVDRLRLGTAAGQVAPERPYARWQLRPAPLPRALRDAGTDERAIP